MYKSGRLNSVHYLLPYLAVRGEPLNLDSHFMFEPMYRLPTRQHRPSRSLFKTARQVGKTTAVGSSDILCGFASKERWKSLFVTPLFEQVKKISTDVVGPMVSESGFSDVLINSKSKTGVLSKSYASGHIQTFSYAYLDSMRIRSISGIDLCNIDEVQHILNDHFPVILETMSARPNTGFANFTGTPLSFANPIQKLWENSSQCEWVVKCTHCNKYNIPSIDHDLLKMIGKTTIQCAKCGGSLDCRKGQWLSPKILNPIEMWNTLHNGFAGFHISQVIHPLHYLYPDQWSKLLKKMHGEYSTAKFYNEVLGESYDSADRMLTLDQLKSACVGNLNDMEHALRARRKLDICLLAVDWGGGGENSQSYTKIVVGGCRPGTLDVEVNYMECLPKYMPDDEQIMRILELFKYFKPLALVHDYNGMGHLSEPAFKPLGLPQSRIWNMAYTTAPGKPVVYYIPPEDGNREVINVDRTRSIGMLFNMLKSGRVKLPAWDSTVNKTDQNKHEPDDFMAMYGEQIQRPNGNDIFRIRTDADKSDDYVMATNYLACGCWFHRGELPAMSYVRTSGLTAEDLLLIDPQNGKEDWGF